MARIRGVNIPSTIVPFDSDDTYPTHLAEYGKGGFRSVSDLIRRDNIPNARREVGMLVYVISEDITYKLNANGEWEKYIDKGGANNIKWKTINNKGEIVEEE